MHNASSILSTYRFVLKSFLHPRENWCVSVSMRSNASMHACTHTFCSLNSSFVFPATSRFFSGILIFSFLPLQMAVSAGKWHAHLVVSRQCFFHFSTVCSHLLILTVTFFILSVFLRIISDTKNTSTEFFLILSFLWGWVLWVAMEEWEKIQRINASERESLWGETEPVAGDEA